MYHHGVPVPNRVNPRFIMDLSPLFSFCCVVSKARPVGGIQKNKNLSRKGYSDAFLRQRYYLWAMKNLARSFLNEGCDIR